MGRDARAQGGVSDLPGDRTSVVILIASPTEGVRKRWRRVLRRRFAIHEVAQRTALERSMASLKPAILLLDLALRRLHGLRDLPAIQRLSPRSKIVLLTRTPSDREGLSVLKAGAKGYCDRAIAPSLLRKAVERIRKGEIWIGRKVISDFIEELASLTYRREKDPPSKPYGPLDRLTSRERDVAHLMGSGARNKEIASALKVTEKTVKAHVTSIFRKLGLSNRTQLVLVVAEHNLMYR